MIETLFITTLFVNICIGLFLAFKKLGHYPLHIRMVIQSPVYASIFTLLWIFTGIPYDAYLPDLVRAISVTVMYSAFARAIGGEWLVKYREKDKQ